MPFYPHFAQRLKCVGLLLRIKAIDAVRNNAVARQGQTQCGVANERKTSFVR